MSTTRLKEDSSTDLQQSKQDRAQAKEELAQAKENLERQKYFGMIYLKARDSRGRVLVQNQANEALVQSAHMSVEFFCEAVKDLKFAAQFIWETPPAAKNDKKAEERDRTVFAEFAKQNRYGEGIANFSLAREILGYGQVTEHGLTEAVQRGRLRLAPASADELEEREAERIDQEQLRLRNMPSHLLRPEAAQAMVDSQQQARVNEGQRVLEAKKQAEAGMNYPPIPAFHQGKRVDQKFFKECNRDTMRWFLQRFGEYQVTQKIRGLI